MPVSSAKLDEALRLHRAGRLGEALAYYERILANDPEEPAALHLKGLVLHQQGNHAAAADLIEHSLSLQGENPNWWRNLGICRQALGDLPAATLAFRRAFALSPSLAMRTALAGALLASGSALEALATLEGAGAPLLLDVSGLTLAGRAAAQLGRFEDARMHYERARKLQPGNTELLSALGAALYQLGEFRGAATIYEEYTRLRPKHARGWVSRAAAAFNSGDFVRAEEFLARAFALEPASKNALLLKARIAEAHGDIDDAQAIYLRLLEEEPENTSAALGAVNIDVDSLPARSLEALDALRRRTDAPSRERARAAFVLARLKEHAGNFVGEVALLREGNALYRKQAHYSIERDLALVARIRALLDGKLFSELDGRSGETAAPVFILGMPRSGTSLAEQILSAHSQVVGLGESQFTGLALREVYGNCGRPWPELLGLVDADSLGAFAASYLRLAGGNGRMLVDKAIDNWRFAGLLALAFPRARFIDCRRHPVDTAIGCFRQIFELGVYYTYDTGELVRMFGAWHETMTHWHHLFGDRIYRLDYESLVTSPEQEMRRMLAFCGLPWEDAVLSFENVRRGVITASAVQVRRGIYTGALGRWKRYESLFPEFAPLQDLA